MRAFVLCLGCVLLVVLSGCEIGRFSPETEHVLNRLGYGPDAWSWSRIEARGIWQYIEEQLHPERIVENPALEERLRRLPALTMSLQQLQSRYSGPAGSPLEVRQQLTQAKILRSIYSRRQLEQVLVDFWYNHFNVDARRDIARWAVATYERDAIRPHVLGRFENLLRAVVKHPAMLEYLDNASNFREGFLVGRKSFGVNENFARELLELHTVGPDRGRGLRDINHTARAFTGWTLLDSGAFGFLAIGHDTGEKRVLGLTLPAGRGLADGEDLIRHLARHPDTAIQVSRKLCRRFVAERETGCEVAAAARFLATDGDLREVMREILFSQPFRDSRYYRSKVKRPLHWLASTARAMGIRDEAQFLTMAISELRRLGEEPYAAGPPSGHPDVSGAWLGEASLVRRLNLAVKVAEASGWGLRPPARLETEDARGVLTEVAGRLLPGGPSPAVSREVLRHLSAAKPSRRLADATALLLASPDFAHH